MLMVYAYKNLLSAYSRTVADSAFRVVREHPKNKRCPMRIPPHPRATLSLLVALSAAGLLPSAPALAFEFELANGSIQGSFDTTASLGLLWRVEDPESKLIAIANGGSSRSPNEDDGNLNYDSGDLVHSTFKMTHELELVRGSLGLFTRFTYFYDPAIKYKSELPSEAHDRLGSKIELLDAYIRDEFDIDGAKLHVRAGNQVVSWGESTFIPNGINIINPVDVARLRTPGSELKEAFLPVPILWASQELGSGLTLEAFGQFRHVKTRLEPRGSYFSSNDFISPGADTVYLGFGRRDDSPPGAAFAPPPASQSATRTGDRKPSDGGQFGAALRWFSPALNDSEFSAYFVNYHSRTPLVSSTRGKANPPSAGTPGFVPFATYFAEYPENIRVFGLGLNTTAPFGIALQGEYSYRPNLPLQIGSIELLLATLGLTNQAGYDGAPGGAGAVGLQATGRKLDGYRRVQMHQVQFTGTKSFGPQLKADQLIAVAEVGYTRLNLPDGIRFNGPGVFLPAPTGSFPAAAGGDAQPGGKGYATENSYGYRVVLRADYNGLIGAANVSPRLVFSHDVRGVSPTFNQGARAINVGVSTTYNQQWLLDLAYTNFFGGRTYAGVSAPATVPPGQPAAYASSANPLEDRDFVSASISYSF